MPSSVCEEDIYAEKHNCFEIFAPTYSGQNYDASNTAFKQHSQQDWALSFSSFTDPNKIFEYFRVLLIRSLSV